MISATGSHDEATAACRKMKVTVFVPSLRGGGAERVAVSLAAGFARRGVLTHLVVAQAAGPLVAELPSGVRLVDLRASRVAFAVPALARYLRRTRPDAMVALMAHADVAAAVALRVAHVPTRLIVSFHGPLTARLTANHLKWLAWRAALRRAIAIADCTVAVSTGVADNLAANLGVSRGAIKVVHNPVVSDDLLERGQAPPGHPWFTSRETVLVSAGRLSDVKHHDLLIRAFARLRRSRAAKLIILGDGPERPRLTELAAGLGVEDDVDMPGFVVNPFPYMRQAAVFVLSSRWEGFPLVLVEAMAFGTPIVSTDCPTGPREILEGGKWGRLVPVDDEVALAAAIVAALDEPGPDPSPRAMEFSVDRSVDAYLTLMSGSVESRV